MDEPLLFISYSHDSDEHKAWVLKLATDVRANGVDATLDQWDLAPGQDVAAFMERGIVNASRVLMICTSPYVEKAEAGTGGVGYERLIVTAEVVQSVDTKKFIPVVRANSGEVKVPRFLGPRLYIDFSDDAQYDAKLEELLRELLGSPSLVKPPLGSSPFSGTPSPGIVALRSTGPTGVTNAGAPVLSDQWFEDESTRAQSGIIAIAPSGQMELRFALHDGISKSQAELLTAVRESEIRTFGWPIGITLDNRDEYRPRPYGDGIKAEIAIGEDSLTGRNSYDYWALRGNGDFYLLQSLFEDARSESQLFFNTRIVRVTEALLFAQNLYINLGVPSEARLSARITHRGLSGRTLSSASGNRSISPREAREDQSSAEIVVAIGSIEDSLVDEVQRILAPLFMLFDLAEFGADVYRDIVERFARGEVS